MAAKPVLIIRGAGFGHGVGMSQYGARGMALRGHSYQRILRHYYSGTELGKLRPGREVRVLMQGGAGSVSFSGANLVGLRRTSPAIGYRIVPDGQRLELYNGAGDRLGRFTSPLTVMGPGPIQLGGMALNGQAGHSYRGWLELNLNGRGGIDVVNEVSLDQYVAGVIGSEVSVRWPTETLKAQAVAARTYAITTRAGGGLFDQYPDTRSQVYGGVSSEHPRTAAAIRATRGQVVTHEDKPVVTYFFSTSGGRTEHVEYSFLDSKSKPWLRSVARPLRQRLPAPSLEDHDGPGGRRRPPARAGQGALPGHPGDPPRSQPARGGGGDRGHAGHHRGQRRPAARAAGPARHVGVLRGRGLRALSRRGD